MTKEALCFLRHHVIYFRLEETVKCRLVSSRSSSSAVCFKEGQEAHVAIGTREEQDGGEPRPGRVE